MKTAATCALLLSITAAGAQQISPEAAVTLTADPRFRAVLDIAMKCSVRRVADYINAGSGESAEVLGSAATTYCSEKWMNAAAVEAKIAPEYGITLNSLDFFQINKDSYYPGVTAAALEFRLPKKIIR